jgi:hypothetical protein
MAKDSLELVHLMKNVFFLGIQVGCLEEHRQDIQLPTDFRSDSI